MLALDRPMSEERIWWVLAALERACDELKAGPPSRRTNRVFADVRSAYTALSGFDREATVEDLARLLASWDWGRIATNAPDPRSIYFTHAREIVALIDKMVRQ